MHLLIVGTGSIGKRYYEILKRLGHEVRGIDLGTELKKELLGQDAVFICTPTNIHVEQALECLQKHIPTFIEKPLSCKWDGVENLIEESKSVTNMVSCNFRFLPTMQKFKQIIEERIQSSNCRKLFALQVYGYNLNKWRPPQWKGYSQKKNEGAGIVLEAIHELDYLYWIFGLPTQIYSMTVDIGLPGIENGIETGAGILSRFTNGSCAVTSIECLSQNFIRYCRIVGPDRTVVWDCKANFIQEVIDGGEIRHDVYQSSTDVMYDNQIAHFLEAVSKRTETANPIASHAKILRIALAAKSIGGDTGPH